MEQRIGSTKIMTAAETPGQIDMEFTKKLSAFDVGTCEHKFAGLDEFRCAFAVQVFEDLKREGIPTHYISRMGKTGIRVQEFRCYSRVDGGMILLPSLSDDDHGVMIPLEFICRLEIAKKEFIDRIKSGELTRDMLNISGVRELEVGMPIGPFVECTTKLEKKDRYVDNEEAYQISMVPREIFWQCRTLTVAVTEVVRGRARRAGLRLQDIKVEFAWSPGFGPRVADVVTHDEVRMKDLAGRSYDKEPFRLWLEEQGFKVAVDHARKNKLPLPPYPDIPLDLSRRVSDGYGKGAEMFCNARL